MNRMSLEHQTSDSVKWTSLTPPNLPYYNLANNSLWARYNAHGSPLLSVTVATAYDLFQGLVLPRLKGDFIHLPGRLATTYRNQLQTWYRNIQLVWRISH